MKKNIGTLLFLAGSLALFLGTAELAFACPSPLECANFTTSDKVQDCQYITSQGLPEEQEVLCILWDQSYSFNGAWEPQNNQSNINFSIQTTEIEDTRFILAGKIIIFGFFNYFTFSVLTKSSLLRKCLAVS